MNKVKSELSLEVASLSPPRRSLPRRAFLRGIGLGAAALAPASTLFGSNSKGKGKGQGMGMGQSHGHGHENQITEGDAALLRFAAAAEILETDFWVQYNELGGIPDPEVPGGTGNPAYTDALKMLDGD